MGKQIDAAALRGAIKRDAELVREYIRRLSEVTDLVDRAMAKTVNDLSTGEWLGNVGIGCASDIDAMASAVARRCDHMQALVEVALLSEVDS